MSSPLHAGADAADAALVALAGGSQHGSAAGASAIAEGSREGSAALTSATSAQPPVLPPDPSAAAPTAVGAAAAVTATAPSGPQLQAAEQVAMAAHIVGTKSPTAMPEQQTAEKQTGSNALPATEPAAEASSTVGAFAPEVSYFSGDQMLYHINSKPLGSCQSPVLSFLRLLAAAHPVNRRCPRSASSRWHQRALRGRPQLAPGSHLPHMRRQLPQTR